jgi:hypothetical protein
LNGNPMRIWILNTGCTVGCPKNMSICARNIFPFSGAY